MFTKELAVFCESYKVLIFELLKKDGVCNDNLNIKEDQVKIITFLQELMAVCKTVNIKFDRSRWRFQISYSIVTFF